MAKATQNSKSSAGKRAPKLGPVPRRKQAALDAYEQTGRVCDAAEAAGVAPRTLWEYRQHDPEFAAAWKEAGMRCDVRIGTKARRALEQHLDDGLSRRTVRRKRQEALKDGTVVDLVEEEPATLHPALVRTGLTKLDATWTHPKTEVEHSGSVDLMHAISAARERMAEADSLESGDDALDEPQPRLGFTRPLPSFEGGHGEGDARDE